MVKEKWFDFDEIFTHSRGTRLIEENQMPGDVAYVSSTKSNNGVSNYITPPDYMQLYRNKMTLSNSGSVGYLFYHDYNFVASDHVTVLGLKDESVRLTSEVALYLKPIIEAMRYKYNFGREISDKRIVKERILLPINHKTNQPDWNYMAERIKGLRESVKWHPVKEVESKTSLWSVPWDDFKMEDVFVIKKGKRLTKANMASGKTNFIGAITGNNGIRERISEDPLYEGNCITVNYNGSVGEAYYQEDPFWASDDVNVLFLKHHTLNRKIAMFLISVIYQNKSHFDFGRKWNLEKMKKTIIHMPVNEDGSINWKFMEKYIEDLPLGKYI